MVLTTVFSSVFVAGVSVVSDIPEVQTSARRALVMAGAVTFVAVGPGVWRSSPLIRDWMHRTPMVVRVIVRASFVGVEGSREWELCGNGGSSASSFGSITEMFAPLNPTTFDALVLLVLSLGYVPVLVSWSVSYIVGAGVSLGPDVLISPFVPVVPRHLSLLSHPSRRCRRPPAPVTGDYPPSSSCPALLWVCSFPGSPSVRVRSCDCPWLRGIGAGSRVGVCSAVPGRRVSR